LNRHTAASQPIVAVQPRATMQAVVDPLTEDGSRHNKVLLSVKWMKELQIYIGDPLAISSDSQTTNSVNDVRFRDEL
jgi:hypothetical protein